MRWRALCEPETLPVSSLTHSALLMPSAAASCFWSVIGVTRKPRPSTATKRRVQFLHDLAPGSVGKAGRARQPVRRQQRPIAQKRILLSPIRQCRVRRLGDQHMVDVVARARMRAAERQRTCGIYRRAAAMTTK